MNIASYLLELLRMHECVIVPGFGGFTTNYRSARIDMDRSTFSPPRKELVFNRKLDREDRLLANYIAKKESTSCDDVLRLIEKFTGELWAKLKKGENLNLYGIGLFYFDSYGKLSFEPDSEENLLTEAYGMPSFHFSERKSRANYTSPPVLNLQDRGSEQHARPSPGMTGRTLIIATFIIVALVIAPFDQIERLQILPGDKATNTVIWEERTAPDNTQSQTEKVAEEEKLARLPTETGARYYLVINSFGSRANAEKYHRGLLNQGHNSEILSFRDGSIRVTIGNSFQSKEKAEEAADRINSNRRNSVWVIEWKN